MHTETSGFADAEYWSPLPAFMSIGGTSRTLRGARCRQGVPLGQSPPQLGHDVQQDLIANFVELWIHKLTQRWRRRASHRPASPLRQRLGLRAAVVVIDSEHAGRRSALVGRHRVLLL